MEWNWANMLNPPNNYSTNQVPKTACGACGTLWKPPDNHNYNDSQY